MAAFVTSVLFLACYLTYHGYLAWVLHRGPTRFVNPPQWRPIYLTHPAHAHGAGGRDRAAWSLMTLHRARQQRFEAHRRIARWTWPLWMYVSVTGVVIYLLLYQIFPQH